MVSFQILSVDEAIPAGRADHQVSPEDNSSISPGRHLFPSGREYSLVKTVRISLGSYTTPTGRHPGNLLGKVSAEVPLLEFLSIFVLLSLLSISFFWDSQGWN